MGSLNIDNFSLPEDVSAEEFALILQQFLTVYYQGHFTLLAETGKGRIPVGMALMLRPIPDKPILFLGDLIWFPWASARNKIESTVHFLNGVRSEWNVIEFAEQKDRKFFDQMCRYGVMRRAGTMLDIYGSGPSAVYQTRWAGGNPSWQSDQF